ncbi:MAG: FtsX-like permease family protein [Duncaniella sp.]|nr:FtsX-like permease family protein [Duncaniella sp.]
MKTSLFLASRISLHPESRRLSTGVVIAIAGVALAMTVMIVSISVMLGFKQQIRSLVLAFQAPLTITALHTPDDNSSRGIELTPTLTAEISQAAGKDVAIYPVASVPAILKTDSQFSGVMIKGISAENPLPLIKSHLIAGEFPDFSAESTLYQIAVSRTLASRLGVNAGESVNAFITDSRVPRARKLKVSAIFDTHFTDFDKALVFGNISMVRRIVRADSLYASSVEVYTDRDDETIDMMQRDLSARLVSANYAGRINDFLTVSNIHTSAAQYFNWLALLDTNVVVILVIMMLVSALTLISSLFIIVLERVNMIGILKAMGATDAMIRSIFIMVTLRLVATGLLIGNSVALLFLLLQKYLSVIPLDPEAYYLDSVPVELSAWWLAAVNAGVIIISTLVLILPSRIISSISPARAIRYE